MIKKVCICLENKLYREKFISSFIDFNANVFQIYSYSDTLEALEAISSNHIDYLIVEEGFEVKKLPNFCTLVYLGRTDKALAGNIATINKYRPIDYISTKLLKIDEDRARKIKTNGGGLVRAFVSAKGGVGTTSICIASSKRVEGFKSFYLNLEDFEDSQLFLKNEDNNLEKAILMMSVNYEKIKNYIQEDSGIFYFDKGGSIKKNLEMNLYDYFKMVEQLSLFGYQVFLDLPSHLIDKSIFDNNIIDKIYLVQDGSDSSCIKNRELVNYIKSLSIDYVEKIEVIFNKISKPYIYEDYGLKNSIKIDYFDIGDEKIVGELALQMKKQGIKF